MNFVKFFILGIAMSLSLNIYGQCNKDFELFWADEFDSTAVNTNYWTLTDAGGGFGNQEIQYYQPENATVSDGLLHIKMAEETVIDGSTTYNYTSAKLWTNQKITFEYGRIESRIKMPDAVGSWPAFWMLGANYNSIGWPLCGEIDVMEWVGRGPNVATGSIFFEGTWPDNHLSTPYQIPAGGSYIDEFHIFAIEWEPNEIRYYVDSNHYATYTDNSIAPKDWLFNHDFFLILNCAVGGTGGGNIIDFVSPQFMEVDYVRVYSLPATADSIFIEGPTNVLENSTDEIYKTTYFPNTTYDWMVPNGATMTEGVGTHEISVDFGTEGGVVKVIATNTCGTLTDSLEVTIQEDNCTIVYDDFDSIRNVEYESTGVLTDSVENPAPDSVNSSALVARYERSEEEVYDVLSIKNIALESALVYEDDSRVLYMDVLTSAPIGTQITLQLESSALNSGAYPQGRRSSYIGYVHKQDAWHTIRFYFDQVISTSTQPEEVDYIAVLFDPGNTSSDTYYIDNLIRLKEDALCDPLPTGIHESVTDDPLTVYPNPVSKTLHLNQEFAQHQFSIFNVLGEKVMVTCETVIDVRSLKPGVYVLKNERQAVTFVKQ